MNEVGLDPGIDHLTACELFDKVKEKNGKIISFVSWCGGLPAPEASNNPLGYKFSWSPKGVLMAGLNNAIFKRNGKIVEITGDKLLSSAVDVPILKGFAFEGLPNRNSLGYVDQYNLGDIKDMKSMFRGTLRFKGYSELMNSFARLGFFNSDKQRVVESGQSWADLSLKTAGPVKGFAKRIGVEESSAVVQRLVDAMQWLKMFDKNEMLDPNARSTLDAFCSLLQLKLAYERDERDMVVMHHEFEVEWGNGTNETIHSTLIAYGDPKKYSAMAKTVGLPAAIATEMILNNQVKQRGVIAPMDKSIYLPMLEKLKLEGITFRESKQIKK